MSSINKIFTYAVFAFTLLLYSCDESEDETIPKGKFEHGVLIVNEGNFESANSSVSFINADSITNDIYYTENDANLGDVAQSMSIDGDIAYIVVNNSNKVEVVDANTFESITTIEAEQPRYIAIYDGKGYITEWAEASHRVNVIDLNTYESLDTINTGSYVGSDNVIIKGDKLYVSNNWVNTVSVIDLATNTVTTEITVENSPGQLVIDKNDDLWVICGGGYDADWNPLNDGAIVKIANDNTVAETVSLNSNLSAKLAINKDRDKLYYIQGQDIMEVTVDNTTPPFSSYVNISDALDLYGLGIDPVTNELFVADAAYFQSNGTVYQYNASGEFTASYESGIGPNGFVFR